MLKISIITGVFNEEDLVEDVYEAVKNVFKDLKKYRYEHIFMDNCSADNTLNILKKIAKKDKNIKILSYSKNFGSLKSGFVGLAHTSGDAIIPYEGNMKDPVNLIPVFIKYWEKGYELVYGVRKKTSDNFLLAFLRRLFYQMLNILSSDELPLYFGGFCLIDRKIVNEIKKIDDYKPYLRGLIITSGFRRKAIEFERGKRPKGKGKSKSNLSYLIDFTLNAIISHSITPIRFCFYIGISLTFLSFIGGIIYLLIKLLMFRTLIAIIELMPFLILFFSGIQLFFLGVIGEYIGAIHSQVRKKPFVIIKEKINFEV